MPFPINAIEQIDGELLRTTFQIKIYPYFYITREAQEHLRPGASVLNKGSMTVYRRSDQRLDYSATKGAIVSFSRYSSQRLARDKIRVNGVAPGQIRPPYPATFDKVSELRTAYP